MVELLVRKTDIYEARTRNARKVATGNFFAENAENNRNSSNLAKTKQKPVQVEKQKKALKNERKKQKLIEPVEEESDDSSVKNEEKQKKKPSNLMKSSKLSMDEHILSPAKNTSPLIEPIEAIQEDVDTVNKPKQMKAMRKTSSFVMSPPSSTDSEANIHQLYKELMVKYNNLQNLRETEAERLLSEYKAKAEKRLVSADKLIEKLKDQIDGVVDGEKKSDNSVPEFVKTLTNMEILDFSEDSWEIVQKGRKGELQYRLAFIAEDKQYEYKPVKYSPSLNLPLYLKDEILFNADQISLFFWRVLNFLNEN